MNLCPGLESGPLHWVQVSWTVGCKPGLDWRVPTLVSPEEPVLYLVQGVDLAPDGVAVDGPEPGHLGESG